MEIPQLKQGLQPLPLLRESPAEGQEGGGEVEGPGGGRRGRRSGKKGGEKILELDLLNKLTDAQRK